MSEMNAVDRSAARRWIDVGQILAERSPSLYRRLTRLGLALLRLVIHERALNAAARWSAGLSPGEFADATLRRLGLSVVVEGLVNLNRASRPVVCANHPSGAVEGLVLISLLCRHRGACSVPANDLLCALEPLRTSIVPVRHAALSRRSAADFERAFAGEDPLLVFPAGVTARDRGGRLREAPWRVSFVTRARVTGRDVLPVAVSGSNSATFYAIHKLRRLFGIGLNIEMALLVHEMFRRRGETVTVRFLTPRGVGPTAEVVGGSSSREADARKAAVLQAEVEQVAARLDTHKRRRAWNHKRSLVS